MTPPDGIEPNDEMLAGNQRSARLVREMENMNRTAEEAVRQAEQNTQYRKRLERELERDVRTNRVQKSTLAEQSAVSRGAGSAESQVRSTRDLARETRNVRSEQEKLATARERSGSALTRDLSTLRRYGDYAGSQYLRGQGTTEAQLAMLRRLNSAGIGGGGGFTSLTGVGAGGGRVPLQLPQRAGPLNPAVGYGIGAQGVGGPGQAGPFAVSAAGNAQKYTKAMQAANSASADLATKTGQLTLNEQEVNRQWTSGTNALAAHSTALRRHGALTTEFITAAARGAVTIRELGFQVGATIGKFGGWLVAGSAVYTALGAITQLGSGAIASSSGVNQLIRVLGPLKVNADDAQKSFRELSEHFNLPVGDVTEAAYGMAKVFGTQEDAMKGAEAALFAVKVGELDVGTATRYLTAIVNGFGLSGEDMVGVMDQLNQAQNKFGVSIPDTAAGVAKAAGTFRAAGGDISSLIALITTAQKVTGQTGEVVGTALARSPNFLRKDQNREILQSFGINATDDIDNIIEQAFKVTRRVGGEQRQVLASAIFGPQYGARIGTPLLEQYGKYQEALKKTSPERSAGSSERELDRLLASIQERISAIGNSLQRIGSGLAQAGALDVFGLALTTLQGILDVTQNILDLFNKLPGPIREAAVVGLQLYGTLRLLRRLQFGSLFSEGSAANAFFTPKNQTTRIYREGLVNQSGYVGTELEAASRARASQETRLLLARQQLPKAQAALSTLPAEASAQASRDATAKVTALHREIEILEGQSTAAQLQESALLEQRARITEQQNLLRRGFSPQFVSGAYGTVIPGGITETAAQAAARERTIAQNARSSFIGPLTQADQRAFERATTDRKAMTARFADFAKRGGVLGRAAGTMATTAGRFPASRIGGALTGAGRGLASAAKGIASMVGPLDLVIIGGFLLYEAVNSVQDATERAVSAVENVGGSYSTRDAALKKARERLASAQKEVDSNNIFEKASGVFSDAANSVSQAYSNTDITADPQDVQQSARDTAQADLDRLKEGFNKSRANLLRGREVPLQYSDYLDPKDVQAALQKVTGKFAVGVGKIEKFDEDTNNIIASIRNATNISEQMKHKLISSVRVAQIDAGGPTSYQQLATLTVEDQQKLIDSYSSIISTGDASNREVTQFLRTAYNQIADTINKPGVDNKVAAFKAADSATDTIKQAADAELQRSLLFARGQDERNAAYDQYIKALNPQTAVRTTARQAKDAADRLRRNQQAQDELRQQLTRQGSRFFGGDVLQGVGASLQQGKISDAIDKLGQFQAERERLNKALEQREGDEKRIKDEIEGLKKTERVMTQRLRQLREQARQERFDERTGFLESLGSYRAALAQEGLPQIAVQINNVNRLISRAIDQYGRNSKEVLDLMTQRAGLRQQAFQEQVDLIRSRGEYAAAGLDPDNTVAAARSELSTAQAVLAKLQSNPKTSEKDLLDAATAVRQAETAIQQAISDRADAVASARYELQRARAGDNEVRQAQVDLREQRRNLRTADTLEERLQARAGIVNARRSLQTARAQSEIDDVQFSADIGRLSLDAQIREYRKILNTMNLTKTLRRDLRQRIYQLRQDLENESDGFDIAVGDIKLPTVYDVRRAIQGGINAGPTLSVNSPTTINVNGSGNPEEVAKRVERKQKQAANRNRNKMRSAGLV